MEKRREDKMKKKEEKRRAEEKAAMMSKDFFDARSATSRQYASILEKGNYTPIGDFVNEILAKTECKCNSFLLVISSN